MERSFDTDPLGQYSTGDEAPSAREVEDSASAADDAGIHDVSDEGNDIIEIPSSRLDIESLDDPVTRDTIRSSDMDAPDTPGMIDIEALGDNDLDGTDIPPDALLDRLEE